MTISGAEETFKRISPQIEAQFPAFIREEGPRFVEFLKAYYEFLEQSGGAVQAGRSLIDYQDIDRTLDSFLESFQREFMINIPQTVLADKRLLVKHIRDIYRARGSEYSYRFLFRALFDKEIDLYYPGDYILKASDGRWVKETLLRVGNPITGDVNDLLGRSITGATSGATARVQSITLVNVLGLDLYEFVVEDVSDTFVNGEKIQDGSGVEATIQAQTGSITDLDVITGGAFHTSGDRVTITYGGATGTGVITSTDDVGPVSFRIKRGGSGYRAGSTILNVTGGSGGGAAARVLSIANTINVVLNSDRISPLASVVLSTGITFVSLGTNTAAVSANLATANVSSVISSVLRFANVIGGSINSIALLNPGKNYSAAGLPTVTAIDQVVADYELPGQSGFYQGSDALIEAIPAPGYIKTIKIESSDPSFVHFEYATATNLRGTANVVIGTIDDNGITRFLVRANTYSATVDPDVTAIESLPGRYIDTKGFLSWDNRLQDNLFYQEYSYVIKVAEIVNKYRDIVKRFVHPSGMKMFGQVDVTSIIEYKETQLSTSTVERMPVTVNIGKLSLEANTYVGAQESNTTGVRFSSSGRKMYAVGMATDKVFQYNLTAPFDLTTASYSGKSFLIGNTEFRSGRETTPRDIEVREDGSRLYVLGDSSNAVNQYDMSTNWDLSTAYLNLDRILDEAGGETILAETEDTLAFEFVKGVTNLLLSVGNTKPLGMTFRPTGMSLFVSGTDESNSVPTDTGELVLRISRGGSGYTVGNTIITITGGTGSNAAAIVTAISNTSIITYAADVLSKISNIVLGTGPTFVSLGANSASVPTNFAAANVSSTLLSALSFPTITVGSISAISMIDQGRGYTTGGLPTVTAIDPLIQSLGLPGQGGLFKGEDAILVANTIPQKKGIVYEATMTTAWDISTGTVLRNFVVDENSESILMQDGDRLMLETSKVFYLDNDMITPSGVVFSDDGLTMLVSSLTTGRIYQYDLSTAWDIETAVSRLDRLALENGVDFIAFEDLESAVQESSISLKLATEDSRPEGIAISVDQTKLFVAGSSTDRIYSYVRESRSLSEATEQIIHQDLAYVAYE
jgi:hypothetical protein